MEVDLLGHPYEQRTLHLGRDEEGPVVATLVRRPAGTATRRAVLWIHGWSDYFFQTHVGDWFAARGFTFYALDLRKYGRSLRPYQTPNFCHSLAEYLPELDEAARIIRSEDGHDRLLVVAHSTGALTSALWVHRHAARRAGAGPVDAMILNSPFFDLGLAQPLRRPAGHLVDRVGRRHPYRILPRPRSAVYGHSLHVDFGGEWAYDLSWKPVGGFPVRFGWLAAVRAGHRRLHAGLAIDVPVLVACATRSYRGRRWRERAGYATRCSMWMR